MSSTAYLKKWLYLRFRKRLIFPLCRRFYREELNSNLPAIFVAGAGRSGTTWLADIIASQIPSRLLFEPFHNRYVPAYASFNYYAYRRPDCDDPALHDFCQTLFSKPIQNDWIDKEIAHLFPKQRLIKAIRANLMLGWLNKNFPKIPILFILRHPAAVVASRLQLNWATDSDIAPFLTQPELIDDYLSEHLDHIRKVTSAAEKHAIIWCISNLIPLRQLHNSSAKIIFYENFLQRPEEEISRVFSAIERPFTDSIYKRLQMPSHASTQNSPVLTGKDPLTAWKHNLSTAQIDQIFATVSAFKLDYLYSS